MLLFPFSRSFGGLVSSDIGFGWEDVDGKSTPAPMGDKVALNGLLFRFEERRSMAPLGCGSIEVMGEPRPDGMAISFS